MSNKILVGNGSLLFGTANKNEKIYHEQVKFTVSK